jgi:hypothetical protein
MPKKDSVKKWWWFNQIEIQRKELEYLAKFLSGNVKQISIKYKFRIEIERLEHNSVWLSTSDWIKWTNSVFNLKKKIW